MFGSGSLSASPATLVLEGEYVLLEPLSMDHLDGLCVVGLDPELWRWEAIRKRSREDMQAYIRKALNEWQRGASLPFATISRETGQVIGSTRYMNMDLANRRVEIGATWIGRAWQRTAVNTEAKYLMLRYAFEVLGCFRVELKTDVLNERSRRAILRLGSKEEGVLRRHVVTDTGRVRDTVYYSILDHEWSSVKVALQAKLQTHKGRSEAQTP
ncbi:MAG: GNAT family N-acetyltransferase [Gammaproteobacteria bacterium]|nr:GNAT family N-acetyltransferase [Gammaproteobacteria bacterium]